jgi:hypothetical protein
LTQFGNLKTAILESATTNATTVVLKANLNTTVIKASAGLLYGINGTNVGSTNIFVRLYNRSTAALTIASTAIPSVVFGMNVSSSPSLTFDTAVNFSSGISMIAQQQVFTATTSLAPVGSSATITLQFS